MRRISTATKVVDKFGVGKPGFTNGNAMTGIAATDLEDQWFDHIQEELAAIVEAAGGVVDGSARNQVKTSLDARYAALAGLATQLFSVAPPTGVNHATPLGEFASVLSGNGYVKIPISVAGIKRTLIIQWASGTQTGSTTATQPAITFPIAFPNACLFAHMSGRIVGATGILWAMNSQTSTTTSATGYISSNGTTDQLIPQVLAIGW